MMPQKTSILLGPMSIRNKVQKINSSKIGVNGTFSNNALDEAGNITFTITWNESGKSAEISNVSYDWSGGTIYLEGTDNVGYYTVENSYEAGTAYKNVNKYLVE